MGVGDLVGNIVTTLNQWHHYTCTFNADTRERVFYYDAVRKASAYSTGTYLGVGKLTIAYRALNNAQLQGRVDEVKIWTRALTATETSMVYQNTLCDSTALEVYYRFEQTSDPTVLLDYSGNGRHATLMGGGYRPASISTDSRSTTLGALYQCTCGIGSLGSNCQRSCATACTTAGRCVNGGTCISPFDNSTICPVSLPLFQFQATNTSLNSTSAMFNSVPFVSVYQLPNMSSTRYGHVTFSFDNTVVVVQGATDSGSGSSITRYFSSIDVNEEVVTANIGITLRCGAGTVYNSTYGYYGGGLNVDGSFTNQVVYRSTNAFRSWSNDGTLPFPLAFHCMVAYSDQLHVFTGISNWTTFIPHHYVFSIGVSGVLSSTPVRTINVPTSFYRWGAVSVVLNGRFVVFAGVINTPMSNTATNEVWMNTVTNSTDWRMVAVAPFAPRYSPSLTKYNSSGSASASASGSGNELLVLVGGGSSVGSFNDVWVSWDGLVWTTVLLNGASPLPRMMFHSAVAFSNAIMLFGGATNGSLALNTVYAVTINYPMCQCAFGYAGVNCTTIIDPCTTAPCLNGGICRNCLKDMGDGDRYFNDSTAYYRYDNAGVNAFSLLGNFSVSFWYYRTRLGFDYIFTHGNDYYISTIATSSCFAAYVYI